MASALRVDEKHGRVPSSLPPLQIPPSSGTQDGNSGNAVPRARNRGASHANGGAASAAPLLDQSPPFAHKHKQTGLWVRSLGWLPVALLVAGFFLLALSASWVVNHSKNSLSAQQARAAPSSSSSPSFASSWLSWLNGGHPLLGSLGSRSNSDTGNAASSPAFVPTGVKVNAARSQEEQQQQQKKRGEKLIPTPWTPAGPIFRLGVPDKTNVGTLCDNLPGPYTAEVSASSCWGPICFKRTFRPSRDPKTGRLDRLYLEGVLRSSDGNAIAGAKLHLWQADASGVYGSLHSKPEDCRAVMVTDKNGKFAVETNVPGSYGILSSLMPLGLDLPPYGPRHIHLLVEHPDYPVFTTQVYFPSDPARSHDWRETVIEKGSPFTLKATDLSLQLKLSPCSRRLIAHSGTKGLAGAAESPIYCARDLEIVLPNEADQQPSKQEIAQLRAVAANVDHEQEDVAGKGERILLFEELVAEVTAKGHQAGKALVAETTARLMKAKQGRYESRFALKSQKSIAERIEDAAKKRITAVVCRQPAAPIALCRPWMMTMARPTLVWIAFLYFAVALPLALVAVVSTWLLRRPAARKINKAVSKRLLAFLDRVGLRKLSRSLSAALQRAKFA